MLVPRMCRTAHPWHQCSRPRFFLFALADPAQISARAC